jgi:hypothetical protein
MQNLGHKSIKNTLLYVQLEEALFWSEHEYISKVVKTEKRSAASSRRDSSIVRV